MSVSVSIKPAGEHAISAEQPKMLLLSVFVGAAGGLLAVGYFYLVRFIREFFYGKNFNPLAPQHHYYLILVPIIGGLLIGLLNYFFTSDARSSYGVPGVIEAIGLRGGRIRPRIVIARALAAAICVGAGGAAGKQGSIVQMGLEIGSGLGKWLRFSEQNVKLLVNCGVAALIGANYNTPLGAAIFVFEVIMGELNLAYFSLVVTSSATAALIYRGILGNNAKFTAPAYYFKSPDELLWYVLLGLLCGLLGVVYVNVVFKSEELFKAIRSHLPGMWQLAIPVLGGLVLGLISFYIPMAFGRGTKSIDMILSGANVIPSMMLLLILLKLISVALTMGAWSTGGGYRAGLFTGVMLGSAVGVLFHNLAPNVTSPPATFALVGMAGVFGGFAQAPLTGIVMMSEMTKDYHLIIPLTITSVVAAYTARSLTTETLYMGKLIRRGLDVFNARRADILKGLLVNDAMETAVETLSGSMTMQEAYRIVAATPYETFPVLNEAKALAGIITSGGLRMAIEDGYGDRRLIDLVPRTMMTITGGDTLQNAARKIDLCQTSLLPVVDDANPEKLVGILTRTGILRAYNRDLETEARRARTLLQSKKEKIKIGGDLIMAAPEIGLSYYNRPDAIGSVAIPQRSPEPERHPSHFPASHPEIAAGAELAAKTGVKKTMAVVAGSAWRRLGKLFAVDVDTGNIMASTEISLRHLKKD